MGNHNNVVHCLRPYKPLQIKNMLVFNFNGVEDLKDAQTDQFTVGLSVEGIGN